MLPPPPEPRTFAPIAPLFFPCCIIAFVDFGTIIGCNFSLCSVQQPASALYNYRVCRRPARRFAFRTLSGNHRWLLRRALCNNQLRNYIHCQGLGRPYFRMVQRLYCHEIRFLQLSLDHGGIVQLAGRLLFFLIEAALQEKLMRRRGLGAYFFSSGNFVLGMVWRKLYRIRSLLAYKLSLLPLRQKTKDICRLEDKSSVCIFHWAADGNHILAGPYKAGVRSRQRYLNGHHSLMPEYSQSMRDYLVDR